MKLIAIAENIHFTAVLNGMVTKTVSASINILNLMIHVKNASAVKRQHLAISMTIELKHVYVIMDMG